MSPHPATRRIVGIVLFAVVTFVLLTHIFSEGRPVPIVCSHQATTPGGKVPVADLLTQIREFASAGITCFDLDLSPAAHADTAASIMLLAHPTLLGGAERPVPIGELLGSDFPGVSFTVEPKGTLQSHAGLAQLSALLTGKNTRLDLIVSASNLADAPLLPVRNGIAVPMRDRTGCDLAALEQLGTALPASVRILMPSVACMRQRSVQRFIASWRQATVISRVRSPHVEAGTAVQGAARTAAALPSPEVHAWIVDDCATLREMQALGVERVISNKPLDILAC